MDIKKLYDAYKDIILYLFFGVCTTGVNVIIYWVAAHPLGLGTMPSTVIAWVAAVAFAYVTNRKWVFSSSASGMWEILAEMGSFFACRLATGTVDWACMLVFVDFLGLNDVVIKFAANIIVVVLNYAASKLVIFRSRGTADKMMEK